MVARLRRVRLGGGMLYRLWPRLLPTLALLAGTVVALAAPTTGDPAAGKPLFTVNCADCHSLAAAGSTGTVGPNLDVRKPSFATVQRQVTRGGGLMPAFSTSLTETQIANLAAFVSQATGEPTPSPTPAPAPAPTTETTPAPSPTVEDPTPDTPVRPPPFKKVELTLSTSRLVTSTQVLAAGAVILTLRNRTNRPVRFSIVIRSGKVKSRSIGPHATRTVAVSLAPGRHRITIGTRSTVIVTRATS